MLRLERLSKEYRTGEPALRRRRPRGAAGPGHGADRPLGRRQEHADPLHQPTGRADLGPGHPGRSGPHLPWRQGAAPRAPQDGHDLSGIRPGRAAHGDGERALRPARLCRLLAELAAPLPGRHRGRGLPALERVGLEQLYDQRADQLSGGQRQRVGIARALIQDPDLLLVDEPTASLDPKTSRQIMRLICELCEERRLAAIINIHDVALAQMFVQRIVGLRVGEVVYDGPPDGLDADTLTTIYGEEDWAAARPRRRAASEPAWAESDEERMAGMAG